MADKSRLRWPFTIRLLHWLSVVTFAIQIALSFGPMKGSGMASMLWLPSHISTGVLIFLLTVFRLVIRVCTRAPDRSPSLPARAAAALVQWCLYAFVLAVVITGWLAYRPMPLMPPARLFGSLPIPKAPSFAGLNARDFIAVHSTLFWVLATLVAVHVLVAAMHAVLFRDGVMSGMLFRRSREAKAEDGGFAG
ncbi:cytochrome b [Pseudorhizobium halotolerans]|nr:cytochrome b/b6 domain-containing protein [Pseudorhizobium halotolerans]